MKLILSERELEIIKQNEYKRGWRECEIAHAKAHTRKVNLPCLHDWIPATETMPKHCFTCKVFARDVPCVGGWL